MFFKIQKINRIFIVFLAVLLCFTLIGCKFSEDFATKINQAYENGTPYSYNELMLKFGDSFDKDITGTPDVATGEIGWYKGYKAGDKERERFVKDNQKGKKIKALTVMFKDGYAVKAEYFVVNEDEK